MKKISLLLASTMLATVSAFAQTKPAAPAYTSFDAVLDQDNAYYLYNVETGLFLTGGNNWGTHASVASTTGSTASNNVNTLEDLTLGKAEVKGCLWTIVNVDNTTVGTETVSCYTFNQSNHIKTGYLSVNSWKDGESDDIYVDSGTDKPHTKWFVSDKTANTFKLSFLISTTEDDVTTWSKPAGFLGIQKFADGDTRAYIMEGGNTTWTFVSEEEYEKVQPKLNLYYVQVGLADLIAKAKAQGSTADFSAYEALVNDANADRAEVIKVIEVISPAILLGEAIKAAKEVDPSYDYSKFEALFNGTEATAAELNNATTLLKAITSLKKAIDAALAKYPSLDLSEPKAVYSNLEATLEEVKAAEAKVAEIVSLYEQSQATLDNPADITATIPYVTDLAALAAGNGVLPKNGWTSTKKDGNFHINTWSTEGNSDGTNMTTPFLEYWKAGGNVLDDQIFYRDQEKDPFTVLAGAYRISSNIRLYNESGAEYMTGAYLFGNVSRTNLVNPEVEGAGNEIEGAAYGEFNGMLWYWKDSFETYAIVPANGSFKFGVQTEGANFNWIATKNWKIEYLGDAYDALDYARKNSELAVPEIDDETIVTKSLLADFNAAKDAYNNSTSAESILAAYGTLMPLADELPANIAAWKAYDDAVFAAREHSILNGEKSGPYIELLEEYVGNDAIEPNEDYKHGSYMYIINALTLSTEEIEAETAYLAQLLDDAIKKSMTPGEDVSDMLKNPSFKDGWTGWEHNTGTAGGLKAFPCVEIFGNTVDVYQVVTDVPDGIYSLSCKAFERPADNGVYTEEDPTVVNLFMNDFQTPVKNIAIDGIPVDQAINYQNSFYEGSVGEDYFNTGGTTNHDYEFTTLDGETLYVPNGMSGASYAFRAGRYEQKVYGLVEGGTMKIGLTSNGVGAHWVLWADFKLTYEGKTAEALNNLLDSYIEKAETYMEENEDNMTTPVSGALDKATAAAVDAQDSKDADEMWEALIALNKAMAEAQENVAVVGKLQVALDALEEAANNSEITPSEAALQAYDKIQDTDYYEMTTEEVEKFIEEVNLVVAMLRIPAYEEASDDNPVDMTSVIKNADFEENSGKTITGWTLESKNVQNATTKDSGINGKSTECWNNGTNGYWFNLSQQLVALPEGTYELSARAFNGQVANASAEGYAALYAETSGGAIASAKVEVNREEMTDADRMASAKTYSIIFTVKEGENVTIGFQSIGDMAAQWFMCDDFKLTYYGNASAKEVTPDDGLVDIEGIDADASEISAIYTVAGAKVSSLQKGINIVKYTNGKVVKVLVK